MKTIGITTTVPIEVLIAAGYKVIDLNNIFITSKDYGKYIELAERDGFPKSCCAWIKGIYGACLENNIKEVIGVMEGDCSNTKALIEVLNLKGIKTYPFSYPHSHSLEDIRVSIDSFMDLFKVNMQQVEEVRKNINEIRELAKKIDENTYKTNKTTGFENHLYQVSVSDLNGDANEFKRFLEEKLKEIEGRKPINKKVRLGFIGVPPMTADIYEYVEEFNAHFVYNEVQREFAFPRVDKAKDIYEQYYDYTYVYNIDFRLSDIKKQIEERKIDGIIHYTQAFCYRAIQDIVIKNELNVPVLNIEGDSINSLDSRTKLRLEAFIDMLIDIKEAAI
ncbi:2-hydroxyglutaryl-CoA dehydratase [Clostridium polyendosporum]|uniref:2-hydroxyglutaryl-CoA dehydratase n=1 Tax=Clostridium polyendosporum TaxID=69208 RepID=A0A919VFN3_9CLOT|nr:2-hydroxyacyl-CoA dehydratase [Clostridium polyendosporum]GIM27676.1 2-hydroxyglutaryl-CoA dehydratase [Clostridium polyendosporum]